MKTGNYFYGNSVNTSGLHGKLQDYKSYDGYGSEKGKELWLRAGDSGWAERPFDQGGIYEGFHFVTDTGVDKLIVHAKYPGNKHFNKGDYMTKSAWHHFHRATKTKAGWKPEWCISNPNEVVYQSTSGQVYPYNTLPEYQDLDAVTGLPITNNQTMRITGTFKVKLNNNVWNLRPEPKSAPPDMGDTIKGEEFISKEIETYGELTNGTTLWIRYKDGKNWVSGAGAVSITAEGQDCSTIQAELDKTKAENIALKNEVASFKPITFYQK